MKLSIGSFNKKTIGECSEKMVFCSLSASLHTVPISPSVVGRFDSDAEWIDHASCDEETKPQARDRFVYCVEAIPAQSMRCGS